MTFVRAISVLVPTILMLGAIAAADDPPDVPAVSTLAGSGALGILDGPGSRASFIAPTGIAYGADGRLFVADRDAQRIRVVSRAGEVSTLAGSAPLVPLGIGAGGYFQDGPASKAFFNMPSAVLPRADGSVLVADTGNFCIREIRDGLVSTFAGDRTAGGRDGARASARFAHPVSLAEDGRGDVYVADPPNGVRRIDAAGAVSTLRFAGSESVVSVARAGNDRLLVASATLIQRLDLRSGTIDRPYPLAFPFDVVAPRGYRVSREGLTGTGPAAAVAAFRDDEFVYVDPLASVVRFGQTGLAGMQTLNYGRDLTAVPFEDASLGWGAFRDGPGTQARVDEPLGIAVAADGTVAIADTGNRRIRLLSSFDHRTHLSADALGDELPEKPDPSEFRIAILGNSYVWWNQAWHDSIAGLVEDRLRKKFRGPRRPTIIPIMRQGISTLAELDYVEGVLSSGVVDMVVVDVDTYGQAGGDGFAGQVFTTGWQAALGAKLAETKSALDAAHLPLLLLDFPGASDFPDEFAYARVAKGPGSDAVPSLQNQPSNVQFYRDEVARILSASGVPTLDLWPAFLSDYASADRVPLYASWDHHLSAYGRQLVASHLADRIAQLRPWERAAAKE